LVLISEGGRTEDSGKKRGLLWGGRGEDTMNVGGKLSRREKNLLQKRSKGWKNG